MREPFFFFDRSISTGVPARFFSFLLSIPKEFLFVGGGEGLRSPEIDRSPRDNASIPLFVSRFLPDLAALFNPPLRLYGCWGRVGFVGTSGRFVIVS